MALVKEASIIDFRLPRMSANAIHDKQPKSPPAWKRALIAPSKLLAFLRVSKSKYERNEGWARVLEMILEQYP